MKLFPTTYKVTCHTDHVGPGSTFVAINGFTLDGTQFIPQALKKGATTLVIAQGTALESATQKLIKEYNAQVVEVSSPRRALAELSAEAYGYPAKNLTLIGITGTKGKTTSAYLVHHILKSAGHTVALLGTVKNIIDGQEYEAGLTTPQPDYLHVFFDQCRQAGVTHVVMETAAQALSMERLVTLEFDAVVFTNFSLEHSEFYPDMDEYFKAKCKLFEQVSRSGLVVLNADDDRVACCVPDWPQRDLISMQGKGTLNATLEESSLRSLRMRINDTVSLHSSTLLGEFSVYNILTAYALVKRYGVSDNNVQEALESFEGVPGRIAKYTLSNEAVAIIDNAHTPSSFEAFLKAVRPLSEHVIAIFGAGGDRDALKRPLMGAIAAKYADQVILTTDNPRSEDPGAIVRDILEGVAEEYRGKVAIDLDREQAIKDAYRATGKGSLLVLLGKGPVEYQHIEDEKIPFSEKAILDSLRS